MASLVEIPFVGGVREDVEAKLMPTGVLTSVRNLRLRKDGSWVKRRGYEGINLENWDTGDPIRGGALVAVGERYNDRLLVAHSPVELWLHDPSHDQLVRPNDDAVPLCTFSAAEKQQVVANLDDNISRCDVASVNGYTAVVYQREGTLAAGVRARVYAEDTKSILFDQLLSDVNDAQQPQVIAV